MGELDSNKYISDFKTCKLSKDEYFLSNLVVIEPIPYEMDKGQIFQKFGFIFWSTYKSQTDAMLEDVKRFFEDKKEQSLFVINDDYSEYLKRLAKDLTHNNLSLEIKVFNAYLNLVYINCISGKSLYYTNTFENKSENGFMSFWIYIGTLQLNEREIRKRYKKVLNLAQQKVGSKNCITLFSKIKN